jgi:hypothetical protein
MQSSAATFFASSVLILAVAMSFLMLSWQQANSLLPPLTTRQKHARHLPPLLPFIMTLPKSNRQLRVVTAPH